MVHLAKAFPKFGVGAYTGKAASVLRTRGVSSAGTIHSMIYRPFVKDDGEVEFYPKTDGEISDEFSGFLIDEASMVPKGIHEQLSSYGLPIVYIGDHGQLEPIGTDINLMSNPDIKLEKIHRNAGEIAQFAHHLREGNDPFTFKTEGKVQVAKRKSITDEHIKSTDQIICAFNKTRVAINEKVRTLNGKSGPVQEGDRIICLRNNKPIGIYNGLQGIAKKVISKNKLVFEAEDGGSYPVKYDPKQFMAEKTTDAYDKEVCLFDFSYCITCHKSQGSQFDNMIVIEQYCSMWDMKRWNYTAASRAKHSLIWIVQ